MVPELCVESHQNLSPLACGRPALSQVIDKSRVGKMIVKALLRFNIDGFASSKLYTDVYKILATGTGKVKGQGWAASPCNHFSTRYIQVGSMKYVPSELAALKTKVCS